MKIEIKEKEYEFTITGTVGLMYAAEILLGEPFNSNDKKHLLYLYYAALQASNIGKEIPDVLTFITSLTSKKMEAISKYFWDEWNRIEGPSNGEGEKAENP